MMHGLQLSRELPLLFNETYRLSKSSIWSRSAGLTWIVVGFDAMGFHKLGHVISIAMLPCQVILLWPFSSVNALV